MAISYKIEQCRVRPPSASVRQWTVDVPASVAGKRKRKFFANERLARKFARDLSRSLKAAVKRPRVENQLAYHFQDAISDWLEHDLNRVKTGKKKAISHQTDKYRLVPLVKHFGNSDLAAIDQTMIEAYQVERTDALRSPESINSEVTTLFKILRFAKRSGRIPKVPMVESMNKRQHTRDKLPSYDDVEKVLFALPTDLQIYIYLLAYTGLRKMEALQLRWADIDFEEGWIEVGMREAFTVKTSHSRRKVPLPQNVREQLEAYREAAKSPWLFPSPKKPPKHRTEFKRSLKSAMQKASPTVAFTPQTLRQLFATTLAKQGTPLHVLKQVMGHSPSSKVLDIYYLKTQDDDLRQAVICKTCDFRQKF